MAPLHKTIPAFALLTLACIAVSAADKPNFILAMADDQGWGDMAYQGDPLLKTPVFDEMSRTALRLDRFYAGAPVCSPTRASVMTGRTPNRIGVFKWGYHLRPQEVTIAEALQGAGYTTGHFGKWHLGSCRADAADSPGRSGFDDWFSSPNFFEVDPWMSDNGKAVLTKGEGSEVIVKRALQFVEKSRDSAKPFLAVIWFGSPHSPHVGTDGDLALYKDAPKKRQNFLAEITAMDRAMGQLREGLCKLGVADNTVLWYCSDNGAIAEGSTGGLRGKKGDIYEGGLRVPGIIEWPAKIKTARTSAVPCGTVDMFPTLMELAGAKIPHAMPMDGVSLVSLIDGKMPTRSQPMGFWDYNIAGLAKKSSALLEELAAEQKAGKVRPASEVEPLPAAQARTDYSSTSFPKHAAWLDGDWKLHRIEDKNGKVTWELYNLGTDKTESKDLLSAESQRVTKMQGGLTAWLKSVVNSLNGNDYQ